VFVDIGSSRTCASGGTTKAAPTFSDTGCEAAAVLSGPLEEDTTIPVPSSHESNTLTGGEECLLLPHTMERRRRRLNKRVRPMEVDMGL
jgi:hypothetical protein